MLKNYSVRVLKVLILFVFISSALIYMTISASLNNDLSTGNDWTTGRSYMRPTKKKSVFDIDNVSYLYKAFAKSKRTASQGILKRVSHIRDIHANIYPTKPRFYPFNGTGTTVNISSKYDTNAFYTFCRDKSLAAILPVYSAPGNFRQRRAIRETVGKDCALLNCRFFFIVAISLNETLNRKVQTEYNTERDILMVNKIDTYRDLNNKAVAMLDWLIQYCPQPKYVIHFIDDTYPNLQYFINHLDAMKVDRFIIGYILRRVPSFRDAGNKWFVSKDEWPYPVFPDFIVGTAYAFLNSDSHVLREHIHVVQYLWIEDIWFTGMVAKEANFKFESFKRHHGMIVPSLTKFDWTSYAIIHKVSPDNYYDIYKAKIVMVNKNTTRSFVK